MTKAELIEEIANERDLSKSQVAQIVDDVIEIVSDELAKGGEVALPPLGKFEAKYQNPRTARNPQTGEEIHVAGKNVPKFKAAKGLKDRVSAG